MKKDIVITGVGGQGTLLASKLLAQYAVDKDLHVQTCETIGMAQRGGSVLSHIRIGNPSLLKKMESLPQPIIDKRKYERIYKQELTVAPMIYQGGADILLSFEPLEALRCISFLKEGGVLVCSTHPIHPASGKYDVDDILLTLKEKGAILVDAHAAAKEAGSAKALNVVMLGVLIKTKKIEIEYDELCETIRKVLPEKHLDVNLAAFKLGYELAF